MLNKLFNRLFGSGKQIDEAKVSQIQRDGDNSRVSPTEESNTDGVMSQSIEPQARPGIDKPTPIDHSRLLEKLHAYSDIQVDEELQGLALLARTYLEDKVRKQVAVQDLISLMYSGENRAWLASLAGNMNDQKGQEVAADFCLERMRAGSTHAWARALSSMPITTNESRWNSIAHEVDIQSAAYSAWFPRPVATKLASRLIGALESSTNDGIRESAAAYLLLSTGVPHDSVERARLILRDYIYELDDLYSDLDFAVAAILLTDTDESVQNKSRALFEKCVVPTIESGDANRADRLFLAVEALASLQSPMLAFVLSKALAANLYDILVDLLAILRVSSNAQGRLNWLRDLYKTIIDRECTVNVLFGAALGVQECRDIVWAKALDVNCSPVISFKDVAILACGGDIDALFAISKLRKAATKKRITSDDYELRNHLDHLDYAIATALSIDCCGDKQSAIIRWSILVDGLRVKSDHQGDLAECSDEIVLATLIEYCRNEWMGSDELPGHASSRIEQWWQIASRLVDENGVLQANAYASLHQTAKSCMAKILSYKSANALTAVLFGKDPELDDDQKQAVDKVRVIAEVWEDADAGKFGRAINGLLYHVTPAMQRFPNHAMGQVLPYCKRYQKYAEKTEIANWYKRLLLETEINFLFAFCCGALATDSAPDAYVCDSSFINALWGSDEFTEIAKDRTIEYGSKAENLARRVGDDDLARNIQNIMRRVYEYTP